MWIAYTITATFFLIALGGWALFRLGAQYDRRMEEAARVRRFLATLPPESVEHDDTSSSARSGGSARS